MQLGFWVGLAVLVVAFGAVRLAPIPTEAWHIDPTRAAPPGRKGVLVSVEAGQSMRDAQALLERLDRIVLDTPRTRRVAGAPATGRVTYVTRSLIWGFPDLTTVQIHDTEQGMALTLFGRARFGDYDWGVNAARVERWLSQLNRAPVE